MKLYAIVAPGGVVICRDHEAMIQGLAQLLEGAPEGAPFHTEEWDTEVAQYFTMIPEPVAGPEPSDAG